MRLSPGQDTVLSWGEGAVDCRVVAAAGGFVLLLAERLTAQVDSLPGGTCSLTFLDGRIPMGFEGLIEAGAKPGELRFQMLDADRAADRRASVRLPITADITVTHDTDVMAGTLLDISAGGMRFRHPGRLPAGALIHVLCDLPAGGPNIEAHAIVRLAEQGIASVEFTAIYGATPQDIGVWTVDRLRASLIPR